MAQVSLRKKPISKGRHSFYLDFYPAITHPESGKLTRREFLGLYVWDKPKTELETSHNKQTGTLAKNIQAQRQLMIQADDYGFLKKKATDIDFLAYFEALVEKQTAKNRQMWLVVHGYLCNFTGNSLRSSSVNEAFCNEFREFLLNTNSKRSEKSKLKQNSAHSYFKQFRLSLKHGFKDGVIKEDLYKLVKPIPPAETNREFLSQEELQRLARTECSLPILKKAGLFSALTGLRFSDIEKMTWAEVRHNKKDGYYIQFIQQKTGGAEVHPISDKAHSLLGERGKTDDKIFEGLKYSAYTNLHLKAWVAKAGIDRNITFHSFRHTYATLLITLGEEIYTVSKLLGHRELETTQIYAKIVDDKKRKAANKIDIEI